MELAEAKAEAEADEGARTAAKKKAASAEPDSGAAQNT